MEEFSIEVICNFKCDTCGAWFSKASPTWKEIERNNWHCVSCGHVNNLTKEQGLNLVEHVKANLNCNVSPFPLLEALKKKKLVNVKGVVESYLKYNGYDGLFNEALCGCKIGDTMECYEDESGCEPGYLWVKEDIPEDYEAEDWDYMIGPEKPPKKKNGKEKV